MATTPVLSNYINLDFDSSKAQQIAFLQAQTEYKDVQFTGSGWQMMLNATTYAFNQLAKYANMSITELFLDSAQLRSNIVSHAKELGYVPRSPNSAYATITLKLVLGSSNTGFNDIFIPVGTHFSASFNNQNFSFVTLDRFQMLEAVDSNGNVVNPGTYLATIQIYEGLLTNQIQNVQIGSSNPLYTISNQNIDTRFITVTTQEVQGSTNVTDWSRASNIVTVDSTSNVFWVQEGPDGFWQIYFGDGIIGAQPSNTAQITFQYLVTKGSAANGISTFALIDSITRSPSNSAPVTYPPTAFVLTVNNSAAFGSDIESSESVSLNAPQVYKTQNRAVIQNDYTALLTQQYGFIQTMNVWGGEKNNPPQYGSVFISIKPIYGNFLSPATKQDIVNTLVNNFSILGITPKVVDPDFTYIYVNSQIFYKQALTTLTAGQLQAKIQSNMQTFFTQNVSFFNASFYFSKFVAQIDETDNSIQGNNTTITMAKVITPTPNVLTQYTFQFFNPIEPGTVSSIAFTSTANQVTQLKDDGNGNMNVYIGGTLFRSNVGTVNYTTGVINLTQFSFAVNPNTQITMQATPQNEDLVTSLNNLIVLQQAQIVLNAL